MIALYLHAVLLGDIPLVTVGIKKTERDFVTIGE
jgi:hypothetical protein